MGDVAYIQIDPASVEAERAAAIHCRALPLAFISSLGPRFVTLVYRSIAASPDSCVIVCRTREGEVLGHVAAHAARLAADPDDPCLVARESPP